MQSVLKGSEMSTTQRSNAPGRTLGYVGLAIALAGVIAVLYANGTLRGEADATDGAFTFLFMAVPPIALAAILMAFLSNRDISLVWLAMGGWCGLLAAMTLLSVGIIFLVATVFLLAAFLRANWSNRE